MIAGAMGTAAIATLAIGALAPASWKHGVATGGIPCPFLAVTGVDCPFCGMTRATLAMGSGDWSRAFELHILAPVVLVGAVALFAVVAWGRADALLAGRRPFVLLAAIAAIWIIRLLV